MTHQDTKLMNRLRLIEALHDPSKWPKDFEWRFDCFDGCAMGLATSLGIVSKEIRKHHGHERDPFLRDAFGMTDAQIDRVFWGKGGAYKFSDFVSPEKVADLLEKKTIHAIV